VKVKVLTFTKRNTFVGATSRSGVGWFDQQLMWEEKGPPKSLEEIKPPPAPHRAQRRVGASLPPEPSSQGSLSKEVSPLPRPEEKAALSLTLSQAQ
jgi:hypothetical protein